MRRMFPLANQGLRSRQCPCVSVSSTANLCRLFRCMILDAPFLDVSSIMLDPALPLTQHERDEWGDPLGSPADWDAILGYCPYENADAVRAWPHAYLSMCCDDPLSPYRHALKYASRARRARGNHLVVVRAAAAGGHYGMFSPQEAAVRVSFLYEMMGLPLPTPPTFQCMRRGPLMPA